MGTLVLTSAIVALITSLVVAVAYEGPHAIAIKLRLPVKGEARMPDVLSTALLDDSERAQSEARTSGDAVLGTNQGFRASAVGSTLGLTVVGGMCFIGFVSLQNPAATSSAAVFLAAAARHTDDDFWFDFFAGGVAGAIAKTVSAPIERVKLLIQTQDKIPQIVSGEMPRYEGICDTFVRVFREQGCASFWRGNLPNVLRYFPVAAFNFAFNDMILGWFPRYDPHTEFTQSLCVNLISGGLAGAGSLTIVYPLDYSRTRLAADVGGDKNSPMLKRAGGDLRDTREFRGLGDVVLKTVRSNGFFALYQGYAVSVIGIIAYRAPYFGLFGTLNALNPLAAGKNAPLGAYLLGVLASFVIAQCTSAVAAFVSYPFDTVRRRLQMEANVAAADRTYRGMCHCAYVIAEREGVGALYKGFFANLLRGASTAFMLVLFNEVAGIKGGE